MHEKARSNIIVAPGKMEKYNAPGQISIATKGAGPTTVFNHLRTRVHPLLFSAKCGGAALRRRQPGVEAAPIRGRHVEQWTAGNFVENRKPRTAVLRTSSNKNGRQYSNAQYHGARSAIGQQKVVTGIEYL